MVADASRTPALWNKYDLSSLYGQLTWEAQERGWKSLDGSYTYRNIQDLILELAGKQGVGQCDEITNPNCGATGLDYSLCKQHPSVTFMWIALTNWANFLNKVYESFQSSTLSITALTSDLVEQFFTPQRDPRNLLIPVGIVNGLAGILAVAWGPIGIIGGIGAIFAAFITQAGFDRPDPLVQWAAIQSRIGNTFTELAKAHQDVFIKTLSQLPTDNTIPYDTDPTQTPFIFAATAGAFAQDVPVGVFNDGIYGSLAASGINALWANDGAFIIKISDAAYNKGPGSACNAFPTQTVCLDGVAHIWVRWQYTTILPDDPAFYHQYLETRSWAVRGAYDSGDDNANSLAQYNLDLTKLTLSAIKTFNTYGFPFSGQDAATIEFLRNNPTNLDLEDLLYFSVPVCDIDAIIGPGRFLNGPRGREDPTDPIAMWGGCTCLQAESWPGTNETYEAPGAGYHPTDCRNYGWGGG
ncbi:MAG: hypothetical protein Q9169_008270 [Polycauliona sp. 2 TL-2023]